MISEMPARNVPATPPVVVLVEPQLGENIGAAARAMANFGLTELRIVNPRDGWPNEKAIASASRADHVISNVQVHQRLEDALADLVFVFATTARNRGIPKTVRGPRQAARMMRERAASGQKSGILFGRERWGLVNEEIGLADEIITFPVNPEFASLNIAQAVLLMAYEWMASGLNEGGLPTRNPVQRIVREPATKAHLFGFFDHLEAALDEAGYYKAPELKVSMQEKLRALFQRPGFTKMEVDVLHGVVAALERWHLPSEQPGKTNDQESDD